MKDNLKMKIFGTNDIYGLYNEHSQEYKSFEGFIRTKIYDKYLEAKKKRREYSKKTREKYRKFVEELKSLNINHKDLDDEELAMVGIDPNGFDPEPYYLYDVNEYFYSISGLEIDEFIEYFFPNIEEFDNTYSDVEESNDTSSDIEEFDDNFSDISKINCIE